MKINRHITTNVEQSISIKEISLLSVEEYKMCIKYITPINKLWWLRSPGYDRIRAAYARFDGSVCTGGGVVDCIGLVVRPVVVLQLDKSETPYLQIGDNFKMAGFSWTMISDDMALCNTSVGQTVFREDWRADDANIYEKSDVKKWLEWWAKEKGIVIEKKPLNREWRRSGNDKERCYQGAGTLQ